MDLKRKEVEALMDIYYTLHSDREHTSQKPETRAQKNDHMLGHKVTVSTKQNVINKTL